MIEVTERNKENIAYLVENLQQFEQGKAIKKGLQAGGNLIRNRGKQRLKERLKDRRGTGNLLRSITAKVKKNNAGVLIGFKKGKGGGNHSHLVDRGTSLRKTRRGHNRGKMTANTFWTDTKNIDGQQAVEEIYRGVEKEIQRINEKR